MSVATMRLDFEDCRRRTRRTMTASFLVHVLIVVAFVLAPRVSPQFPGLTEILLIEPGDPAAGAPAAALRAVAERTVAGVAAVGSADRSFPRSSPRAEIAPEPQVEGTFADQLNARLATLQRESAVEVAGASTPTPSRALWGTPVTAPTGAGAGGSGKLALARGGGGGVGPTLALNRGSGHAVAPALAPSGLAAASSAVGAPARSENTGARRSVAGAQLAGPIADRPVIAYRAPAYPEWAKRDAVEGSVTLYFIVRSDGSIKENVLVQKTAGFEDFDENARLALRAWRFQPLGGGRTGEQWGTITFHFRIRDAEPS